MLQVPLLGWRWGWGILRWSGRWVIRQLSVHGRPDFFSHSPTEVWASGRPPVQAVAPATLGENRDEADPSSSCISWPYLTLRAAVSQTLLMTADGEWGGRQLNENKWFRLSRFPKWPPRSQILPVRGCQGSGPQPDTFHVVPTQSTASGLVFLCVIKLPRSISPTQCHPRLSRVATPLDILPSR